MYFLKCPGDSNLLKDYVILGSVRWIILFTMSGLVCTCWQLQSIHLCA